MKTLIQNHQTVQVQLDGSQGEGGGQILRSALSLSAVTGKSFALRNIRAGRKRPGLMRQHLTCVEAAARVCSATVSEIKVGTDQLSFSPSVIEAVNGEVFEIGTAGSTLLLFQTLLPILNAADSASSIILRGGTHAKFAPCADYVKTIFLPCIELMGGRIDFQCSRHGFFPAGGGEIKAQLTPARLGAVEFHEKPQEETLIAEILSTPEIPTSVAEREISILRQELGIEACHVLTTVVEDTACPGNAILIHDQQSLEVWSPGTLVAAYGERGKNARQVAKEALRAMRSYLHSPAPVDQHLADQLLLPMALAGSGSYTAAALTPHFFSNVNVIESFLPIHIRSEKLDRFAYRVEIQS